MSSLATPSLAVPSYLASPVANLQESTMVRRSAGWQKSKDQLYAWMSVPSLEFDEGDVPPSANTLAMAMDLATQLADQNEPPPLMVSPDGNGGVVFGWKDDQTSRTIEVKPQGVIEMITIRNGKLQSRRKMNLPPRLFR